MPNDPNAVLLARLKKSVDKIDTAQAARDRLIVEATKKEIPVPKVAAAVGLSRARVYQIITEQGS